MSAEDAGLGALTGEHRARSWESFAWAVVCAGVAIGTLYRAVDLPQAPAALWIPVVVMPLVAVRFAQLAMRFTKVHLLVFERGLVLHDHEGDHVVAWTDVGGIDECVVGGRHGATLVSIRLAVPSGIVVVPKELQGFREVYALIGERVPVLPRRVGIFVLRR